MRRAVTQADGSFSLLLPVGETTRVRAVAEGIGSQTRTITVVSTVRIRVRARAGGAVVVTRPRPPARCPAACCCCAAAPSADRHGAGPRRALPHPPGDPRRGRYQAVFIPRGERAERSTSNTGVIR